MQVEEIYVVYTKHSIMDSEIKGLRLYSFKKWIRNAFETEKEAIQALMEEEETWVDFIILKEVNFTK